MTLTASKVREITYDHWHHSDTFRWQKSALFAIQEAAEAYLVGIFEEVNDQGIFAKRSTIQKNDMAVRKHRARTEPWMHHSNVLYTGPNY
jgi:histone H3/H4